jgi:hypothetical protein
MTNSATSYQIGGQQLLKKIRSDSNYARYREAFLTLNEIEIQLNRRFARMEEAIHALIISALIGEPLLFVGDPGTGKSLLIRSFCQYLGAFPLKKDAPHLEYFEYLLTPFTEPGELFGYFEIVDETVDKPDEPGRPGEPDEPDKPRERSRRRIDRQEYPDGMMQSARVVYLDEVFNGSSAILNSLLAFMNERLFHDRGRYVRVRMEAMYGATNHVPETPELRAIYDRFFLRCQVSNIKTQDANNVPNTPLQELIEKGWGETYPPPPKPDAEPKDKLGMDLAPKLLENLWHFRQELGGYVPAASLFPDARSIELLKQLNTIINEIRKHDLSAMSNRRVVKFVNLLLMHAIYDAVIYDKPKIEITQEYFGLWCYILDRRDGRLEALLPGKYATPGARHGT